MKYLLAVLALLTLTVFVALIPPRSTTVNVFDHIPDEHKAEVLWMLAVCHNSANILPKACPNQELKVHIHSQQLDCTWMCSQNINGFLNHGPWTVSGVDREGK